MIFRFAETARFSSAKPPLVRASVSVQYPTQARLGSLDGIAPIQAALLSRFPVMNPATVNTALMFQIGSSTTTVPHASEPQWIFEADNGFQAIVSPTSTTLTVDQRYTTREAFSETLRPLIDTIAKHIYRINAMTIRYINAIPVGDDLEWITWLKPEVAGWVGASGLDAQQRLSMSITILNGGNIEACDREIAVDTVVRHGLVQGVVQQEGLAPTGPAFIIDTELTAKEHPQHFGADTVNSIYCACNKEIAGFFLYALTQKGCEHFGIESESKS